MPRRLALLSLLAAAPAFPQNTPLFERDIKPILSAICWKCHGMEDRKAGLDLRTPPLILQGGKSGPAITLGAPESSPLYTKLANGAMPPAPHLKLSKEQITQIRDWIQSGAEASRSYRALTKAEAPEITPQDRAFWAFQKLGAPTKSTIDKFLTAKLADKHLTYAPKADPATLLRRASLHLTGLPPTPTQQTYEAQIDHLLNSPHFGERWGRHWLDAAGYADVIGIDNNPTVIRTGENKWKYRDYVVRSLNADKPYNRFLTEQLAGDQLTNWRQAENFTPETRELLTATGFLRNAADDTDNDDLNLALIRTRVVELTLQNVTSNLLGLTVACAQCHSHRYDPIPQLDYYHLAALFTPVFNHQHWPQSKNRFLPDVSPAEKQTMDAHNAALDTQLQPLQKQLAALRRPYELTLLEKRLLTIPAALRPETRTALNTAPAERTPIEKFLVTKLGAMLTIPEMETTAAMTAEDQTRARPLQEAINKIESQRQTYGKLQAIYDVAAPSPAYFLRRGNIETPITEVRPGFLSVLTEPGQPVETADPNRRLAFAQWLTRPNTPASALVARVAVNRVWQHLFGTGLVASADNFGHSGTLPTHPELLDFLANELISNGWHIKPIIRQIMLSDAYQQSSHRPDAAQAAAIDPANSLLWRMPLRRLESEAIRDQMLAVSGQLDLTLGGAPVAMDYRPDGMVTVSAKEPAAARNRRSLYLFQRRNFNLTLLSVFDEPVMATNCVRRNTSAVVLQSLALLNDETVLEQATHFAARVQELAGPQPTAQVEKAFQLALNRPPSPTESQASLESLTKFTTAYGDRQKALTALCHTLFNMNEFLYVQ